MMKPRKTLTPKSLTAFLMSQGTRGDKLFEVLAKTIMLLLIFRASNGAEYVEEIQAFNQRIMRLACDHFLRKGKR